MKSSLLLWGNSSLDNLENCATYELLDKLSLVQSPFDTSKIYAYLPLGNIVLNKIQDIMRQEMLSSEVQELTLPPIQPYSYWEISGRAASFRNAMIFADSNHMGDGRFILSPTDEEVSIILAKKYIRSYRQLPLRFFQIADKFRDDGESKHGIVRSNIFRLLEAYSLDKNQENMEESAKRFQTTFTNILNRLKISFTPLQKREGYTTFLSFSNEGDTKVGICSCGISALYKDSPESCTVCKENYSIRKGIELGCIMKDGIFFSDRFKARFQDESGNKLPFYTGTYGLGISRVIHSIVDQNRDKRGISWPAEIVPFDISVIPINPSDALQYSFADKIYRILLSKKYSVLLEDRQKTIGERSLFCDAIGVNKKIIVGPKDIDNKGVTLQLRAGQRQFTTLQDLESKIAQIR